MIGRIQLTVIALAGAIGCGGRVELPDGSAGGTGGASGNSGGSFQAGGGALSCSNGMRDVRETDVDCGGPCPTKCATGKNCGAGSDCVSGVCASSVCATP